MSLSYFTRPLKTWSLIVAEAESLAMTGFKRLASPMELSMKVLGVRSDFSLQAKRRISEMHKNKKAGNRQRRRGKRIPDTLLEDLTVFLSNGCAVKNVIGFSTILVIMAKNKRVGDAYPLLMCATVSNFRTTILPASVSASE